MMPFLTLFFRNKSGVEQGQYRHRKLQVLATANCSTKGVSSGIAVSSLTLSESCLFLTWANGFIAFP